MNGYVLLCVSLRKIQQARSTHISSSQGVSDVCSTLIKNLIPVLSEMIKWFIYQIFFTSDLQDKNGLGDIMTCD